MSTHYPYYRRPRPKKRSEKDFLWDHIDFSNVHLPAFGGVDAVAKANAQFDDRVAAVVRAFAGPEDRAFWERPHDQNSLVETGLLESHDYGPTLSNWNSVHAWIPTKKCLAVIAYPDYFDTWGGFSLRGKTPAEVASSIVSKVILASTPGWCGSFGPNVDQALDLFFSCEGNYDMAQMYLLPMAYRYYDELIPDAREHLITWLLAHGAVHGPGNDDTYTSGFFRETWSRAGMVSPFGYKRSVGETENHILMIMTARYLTNQLLYQRDPKVWFDNRRNSMAEVIATVLATQDPPFIHVHPVTPHKEPAPGSCTFLLLDLLQRILRDDFSEYNAKGYQQETRWALVNLCNYAYDHEIRLAARMVLDYIAGHFVVSTNDLRRLVPFRRRNEYPKNARDDQGFMTTAILDWQDGADPMGPVFGILAGNVRAYETQHPPAQDSTKPWTWGIRSDEDGGDEVIDALSDYRIPPSIHDLFVNDLHRRFYQRLHRTVRDDEAEVGGHRNCDNMEIYAGSPSYLITAGGVPATYAIDPYFLGIPVPDSEKQLGVAVTTTFMPTIYMHSAIYAQELIQFSSFAEYRGTWNYGVAPDFACGYQIKLPDWLNRLQGMPSYVSDGNFIFINQRPAAFAPRGRPGFYLAIYQEKGFGLLEAFDTWLHPEVVMTFADFQSDVKDRARTLGLSLQNNVKTHYKTWNGNEFDFYIWMGVSRHEAIAGAEVLNFKPGDRDPQDAFGDAGKITDKFLNGTVMNSPSDAVVEITNHYLPTQFSPYTKLTLDMHDLLHPKRISETGEIEQAGFDNEVWLDFDWKGSNQGDACQPFSTLAGATAAVADGGVIKIIPGQTRERTTIGGGKRMKLVAPIGGVTIGVR
jgi:hypothetical protein